MSRPDTITCTPDRTLRPPQGQAQVAATTITGTASFGDNGAGGPAEVTLTAAGGGTQQGHHTWAPWTSPFDTGWQFVTFSASGSFGSFRAGGSPQLTLGVGGGSTVGSVRISASCDAGCAAEWSQIRVDYYRNGVRVQGGHLDTGCTPGCDKSYLLGVHDNDDDGEDDSRPQAGKRAPSVEQRFISPSSAVVEPDCPDNTSVVVTGYIRFRSNRTTLPHASCMVATVSVGVA